jgi:CspA family cold shock protein
VLKKSSKNKNNKISKMKNGKVKFFDTTKGFGFIKENGSENEYFVHITGLVDQDIKNDDDVTFEVTEGRRGLNAINVRLT